MRTVDEALACAKKIQGWMSDDELRWLYETSQRYETAAHIGVWRGRSIVAAAAGIRQRIYAIDNWGPAAIETQLANVDNRAAFLEAMINLWPVIAAGKCVPLAMESTDASRLVDRVDMVFIDGAHDKASVDRDINAWLPRTNCLLAGHDKHQVASAICRLNWEAGPGSIWYVHI